MAQQMRRQQERQHKINSDITASFVRLVGNGEPQMINRYEAMKLAQEQEKDLIQISETDGVPIVRIEEYTKFVYNLAKKEKEKKKKTVQTEIREIKLSYGIDDHDLKTKANKVIELLNDGDKVKCVLYSKKKGRKTTFMVDNGELIMLKLADMVQTAGLPEALPKLEADKWVMMLKQKTTKK